MNPSIAADRIREMAGHPVCQALLGAAEAPDLAVVGGSVRDLLLGHPHPDVDLCVTADPVGAARILREKLGGSWFVLDAERRVARSRVLAGTSVDIALRQGDSWDADLRRRDLTINALGVVLAEAGRPLASPRLLDPTGGLADLDARLVRATGRAALEADPVRLLRVHRFAATLAFGVEHRTRAWLAELAPMVRTVAPERIRDELFKLLAAPEVGPHLADMAGAGLVEAIVPELAALRGTVSTGHFDGFAHRLEAVRALDWLVSKRGPWDPAERDFLDRYLGGKFAGERTRLSLARAALLVTGLGRATHAGAVPGEEAETVVGGRTARPGRRWRRHLVMRLADRLRLSVAEARWLQRVERERESIDRLGGPLSRRSLYWLFREAADAAPAVALLALAEHQAARDLTLGADESVEAVRSVLREAISPDVTAPHAPLIRGDELQAALGLPTAKDLRPFLDLIEEERATGTIRTRQEAVALAARYVDIWLHGATWPGAGPPRSDSLPDR